MILSPETASQVAAYNQKILNGSATKEDVIAGVKLLREARFTSQTAAQASAKGKPRVKGPVDVDALFDQLDKL